MDLWVGARCSWRSLIGQPCLSSGVLLDPLAVQTQCCFVAMDSPLGLSLDLDGAMNTAARDDFFAGVECCDSDGLGRAMDTGCGGGACDAPPSCLGSPFPATGVPPVAPLPMGFAAVVPPMRSEHALGTTWS